MEDAGCTNVLFAQVNLFPKSTLRIERSPNNFQAHNLIPLLLSISQSLATLFISSCSQCYGINGKMFSPSFIAG